MSTNEVTCTAVERTTLASESEYIDFQWLSSQQPTLFTHKKFNFKSPTCQLQLTKALLKQDFNVDLVLDTSRLIPPVPNRLNYLKWIAALIGDDHRPDPRKVLDIGTGASAIYALIGAKHFGFHFLASDTDVEALEFAQRNVSLNKLDELVSVVSVPSSTDLQRCIAETLLPAFETDRNGKNMSVLSLSEHFRAHLLTLDDPESWTAACRGPVRHSLATDVSQRDILQRLERQYCSRTMSLEGQVLANWPFFTS